MGSSISIGDKIQPSEFNSVGNGNNEVPATYRSRSTTDVIFLLFHTLSLVILIPLLVYCVNHGNIYRIVNGYDSCGNICGQRNSETEITKRSSYCNSYDMTQRKYILVFKPDGKNSFRRSIELDDDIDSEAPEILNDTLQRVCLKNCSSFQHYRTLVNRCVLEKSKTVSEKLVGKSGIKDFFEEVTEDFELCWPEILYLCLVSLVFSCVIMILLRFLVGIVVWLVLVGVALACLLGTFYLWVLWRESKKATDESIYLTGEIESQRNGSYLAFAIVATIITFCVVLVIVVMRKRIQLVIRLFKEAGKAVAAMPLILFQPMLTFLCATTAIACWIYFSLWIESAGYENEIGIHFFIYKKDFWIRLTRWYNIFITLWMIQFLIGCQHVVIASAVSAWYFCRNKNRLGSPIFFGFYNLTRYHLGSVSFGSFLIAVVQFVRIIMTVIQKYLKTHEGKCVEYIVKCCQCCLYCLEKFIKFISRNAYIEIAIHGYSFCKAGQQAFKILASNALRVAAINSVGDFVLFLAKVLIVMATVLVGTELIQKKEGVLHAWVPLTLSGLFAYLIAHCFLSVYEMAIDTVFICFCEDCEENDGISRPYYMSRGLMEFVENSKKAIIQVDKKREGAWEIQPSTVSGNVQ